jgi:CBS domain containing-hemolysin-like protein
MSINQAHDKADNQLKTKDRIDYLFKIINRFDFYINSTNTKASLIIAWNGVVIGAILLKYTEVVSIFQSTAWAKLAAVVLLTLIGTCSLISTVFVFSLVFPFLRPTRLC